MATYKVSKLKLARDKDDFKATWTTSSGMKSHISGLRLKWSRSTQDESGGVAMVGSDSKTVDVAASKASATPPTELYKSRKSFYPLTKTCLRSLSVSVKGKKKSGSGYYDAVSDTFKTEQPKTPSLSLSVDQNTLTADVSTTESDTSAKERYDTLFRYVRTAWNAPASKELKRTTWTATSKTVTLSKSEGLSDVLGLSDGQWVKVEARARNRGLWGSSELASKSYVFAPPAVASNLKARLGGQQVLVSFKLSPTSTAPVDEVQLVRCKAASMVSDLSSWDEVDDASGNQSTRSLHDTLSNATPAAGQHTWYRVRTTHGTYVRYSEAVELSDLYTDPSTAESDCHCLVISATSNGDGESVTCVVGWEESSDQDTMRLSWSDDYDAWDSTSDPDDFEFPMASKKSGTQTVDGTAYATAKVKVTGLADGTTYFFRARRESEANSTQGSWSPRVSAMCSSTPTVPVLTAPGVVERHRDVQLTWTAGEAQSAWALMLVRGETEYSLMSGEGGETAATVPYSLIAQYFAEAPDSADLKVGVTYGGDWSWSETATVTFADRPNATLTVDSAVITARPWAFTVGCDQDGATATVELVSHGILDNRPDGSSAQVRGQAIWSATVDCGESATLPDSARLIDTGVYTLRATPYAGGLFGDSVEQDVTVAWAHQAAAPPSCAISVDTDARSAVIAPTAPSEALSTDVCDFYRSTPDGLYLVASSVPMGTAVTDPYAPFSAGGECEYRIATRTADGDLDWDDYPYTHKAATCRVDFDGGSVELPYDLSLSDGFSKDFESRAYIDGSAPRGFWNPTTERTNSISATAVDASTQEALRLLARSNGSCFVRTPDGCAYEADVQVSGLDADHSAYASVSLDVTELALSQYGATYETAEVTS